MVRGKLPRYTIEELTWRRMFENNGYCTICMKYFEMMCPWIEAIERIVKDHDVPEKELGCRCEHFE